MKRREQRRKLPSAGDPVNADEPARDARIRADRWPIGHALWGIMSVSAREEARYRQCRTQAPRDAARGP